jgi:hypothetical protein
VKHIGNKELTDCDLEILIEGVAQDASVKPGTEVSIFVRGRVWSRQGCPKCIDQVVIGVEDTPIGCAYEGIPGLYPGAAFETTFRYRVPEEGYFRIFGMVDSQIYCYQAMSDYKAHPEWRFQLGSISSVTPPPEVVPITPPVTVPAVPTEVVPTVPTAVPIAIPAPQVIPPPPVEVPPAPAIPWESIAIGAAIIGGLILIGVALYFYGVGR